MKKKSLYQVSGYGHLLNCAATSGSNAVHQFRRRFHCHTPTDHQTGGYVGIYIERLAGENVVRTPKPPVFESRFRIKPEWEWRFHSMGPEGNKKPIVYWTRKATGRTLPEKQAA